MAQQPVLKSIQQKHEKLFRQSLEINGVPTDASKLQNLLADVRIFLTTIAQVGTNVKDVKQRTLLRALIHYWSSFINDKTGVFPIIRLQPFHQTGSYSIALRVTVFFIPLLATIISMILYIVQWPLNVTHIISLPWLLAIILRGEPFLLGTLLACLLWLLLAVLYAPFTTVDRANPRSYGLLLNRANTVDARVNFLYAQNINNPSKLSHQASLALQEAQSTCKAIYRELRQINTSWVLNTGYLKLLMLMDKVEEAFIAFEPIQDVIRDALYDQLCLQDSHIDEQGEMINKLRLALTRLAPSAAGYFKQGYGTSEESGASDAIDTNANVENGAEFQARMVLRQIRRTLNEYRRVHQEMLMRMRNQLIVTALLTGLVTYILLGIVALGGVPSMIILAAGVFYLVGAMPGLFYNLYRESATRQDVDDYGLTGAYILAAPLLSGLAGIGGVVVIQEFFNQAYFSKFENSQSLLVAAIFGLAPNILLNTLRERAEKYKADLKSIEGGVWG